MRQGLTPGEMVKPGSPEAQQVLIGWRMAGALGGLGKPGALRRWLRLVEYNHRREDNNNYYRDSDVAT